LVFAALFGIGDFFLIHWKSYLPKNKSAAIHAVARPVASVVPRPGAPNPAAQGNWAGGPLPMQLERPLRGQGYAGQPPDDRGFSQPMERNGNSIALPFGRLPRPDLTAIADGPVTTMLQEADAYATQHPDDFRAMVDRYREVMQKAQGTEWERQVNEKLQTAISRHQEALRKAMEEYQQKMMAQLRAHQPQAAYDVWKDFPQNLRTFQSDQEIADILGRNLPQGFGPK
jgi:hypothetical protein